MRPWLLILMLASLAGCRSTGQLRSQPPAVRDSFYVVSSAPSQGIVFIADGAGDYRELSVNVREILAINHAPLQVERIAWSHGYGRFVTDQTDTDNHRKHALYLAERVCRYRATYPGRAVYLLGTSAGCEVLLSAAEMLPPDAVERIVLLAPSVCAYRDLRPALRSARSGIDVFYSELDRMVLGLGVGIAGTTEGDCNVAAGRTGFQPVIASPADAAFYQRLRQHPWHTGLRAHGHNGGHFGSTQAGFLRSHVVPLLKRCP